MLGITDMEVEGRDKKETIKVLESLATKVLKLKKELGQRRPLLIEFCGTPKSGKSTMVTSLNIFLKRNGFKTIVLTERASVCPIENKTHPFFNIWTLTSTVAEIVKNLEQGKDRVDIIISDRGMFDALCWFKWLNTHPNTNSPYLDDRSYKDLESFILMDMWTSFHDLIYVFKVNPETSMKREYAYLLTEKEGSIMRKSVLDGFNLAVTAVIEEHKNKFRSVKEIETDTAETDNSPNEVSYLVTAEILQSLHNFLVEKIGYFDDKIKQKLEVGINSIDAIINEEIKFEDRDKVERKGMIQPISIAVITNPARNKVLVVKKSGKRTSAQSPERDKLLLYVGGHIRKEDERGSALQTLEKTLHREIQEEIGESISIQDVQPFIIYTPDNVVSKRHFAVCYLIEMDLDNEKFKLTSDEFTMKTGTSKSGQIMEVNEVASAKNKLESWSRTILKEVFKVDLPEQLTLLTKEE